MIAIKELIEEISKKQKVELRPDFDYIEYENIEFGFTVKGDIGTDKFNNDFENHLLDNVGDIAHEIILKKYSEGKRYFIIGHKFEIGVTHNELLSDNIKWSSVVLPLINVRAIMYYSKNDDIHVFDFRLRLVFFESKRG